MQVQQLESDIYVLIGEDLESNSVAFINGDEALLVNGMASRPDAESLRGFIEDELRKRARLIVCTHFQSDHLAAFRLFPHAQLIAHHNYRHTFDTELYRSEEERQNFVEPDILISNEMTVKWGRCVLDIFHSPGHTMSSLSIDVAAADLIITGDNVVGNMVYLVYSTPLMFHSELERLRRRGRTHLISGHLGARSSKAIDNALHYLNALQKKVEAARQENKSDEAILSIELESCLAPGVEGSDFETIFHKRNLGSIVERKLFAN
ncbi:MAG: MBL fold metallo-hydrolase [Acidobacteriota bacterium]